MVTVGLFGFGRAGRNLLRILHGRPGIRIGAISDLAEPESLAYLVKFDTLLGRFPGRVELQNGALSIDGQRIPLKTGSEQKDPPPWGDLGVETVLEVTSRNWKRPEAERHLAAGARRVLLLSAPAEPPDVTVVRGVNDEALSPEHRIVSTSSATVNCLAPMLRILDGAFGVRRAIFTTIHAYTGAHRLADVPAEDKRRGRAAAENIIPQESRSPAVLARVAPELAERTTGYAMNVPVSNGSVVDLVCWHERPVTRDSVNAAVSEAAASERWKDLVAFETEPIVSSDIALSPQSAVFDSLATMTLGENVSKTLAWFGSGDGYPRRAVELVERFAPLETKR
jgi:glyceraldehyde 3-phosphate dehydrogenase